MIQYIKEGVDLRDLHPKIWDALIAAAWYYGSLKHQFTVTCGQDGAHMRGSRHYNGRAVDLRVRMIPVDVREVFVEGLKRRLGWGYDVVLRPDHIHVEWDPKPEK